MNIGFWFCIVLVPFFGILSIIFAIVKGNAVKLISGFNSFSEEERKLYDKERIAKDMRNKLFLWAVVMLIGALGSEFITIYFAMAAYAVWLVLFILDVHIDAHKAFEKYLL